ncbi:uncharacterized protein BJ212DRAFT_212146 [Suillus subaureus]|uniref:Secreted protein n=1 Tax=Suillus subaureus TaxID=48587 RepID=A0A9P7EAT5_9AGAM|nr:uncharacterized protein BJ212DRAFT_212146 [Suillus subaureus]KAG1816110.1 hypothetical protein BJ212DRAFT_212146 [Suillus subaureus]
MHTSTFLLTTVLQASHTFATTCIYATISSIPYTVLFGVCGSCDGEVTGRTRWWFFLDAGESCILLFLEHRASQFFQVFFSIGYVLVLTKWSSLSVFVYLLLFESHPNSEVFDTLRTLVTVFSDSHVSGGAGGLNRTQNYLSVFLCT